MRLAYHRCRAHTLFLSDFVLSTESGPYEVSVAIKKGAIFICFEIIFYLGQIALSANVVCVSMRHTSYACSIAAELRSVREQYSQSTPNFVGNIFCQEHVHRSWHATDMLIFVFPSAQGAHFATHTLEDAWSLAVGAFCVRAMRVHFQWSPWSATDALPMSSKLTAVSTSTVLVFAARCRHSMRRNRA